MVFQAPAPFGYRSDAQRDFAHHQTLGTFVVRALLGQGPAMQPGGSGHAVPGFPGRVLGSGETGLRARRGVQPHIHGYPCRAERLPSARHRKILSRGGRLRTRAGHVHPTSRRARARLKHRSGNGPERGGHRRGNAAEADCEREKVVPGIRHSRGRRQDLLPHEHG